MIGSLWYITILLLALGTLAQREECKENDDPCKITLKVAPRLTMMDGFRRVMPRNGGLYYSDDPAQILLNQTVVNRVLTADGVYARMVIAVNDQFPGPELVMYEGQNVEVDVINEMHTDSITIHFHGIHQRNTPWMDGVAYVTQCPIQPGTRFRHTFKASPAGTHWYHAHIGDQRSMGLYGPLIVKKKTPPPDIVDEHVIILQDWNHDMDPETAYLKMIYGNFDCDERASRCTPFQTTSSVDGSRFSRFEFHSGLINGKGRYHYGTNQHNNAPLTKYTIEQGKRYRFRVISAATLYPMRVFVAGHRLTIVASDGRELRPFTVDSFVIQSGERYDFYLDANQTINDYMIVGESLEVGKEKMHVAEAILQYSATQSQRKTLVVNERTCTQNDPCIIFNCPFRYYPASTYRNCTTYNYASGIQEDNEEDREKILNTTNVKEFFLNFAFPGTPGNTPGSVNGRQFVSPSVAALVQPDRVGPSCLNQDCGQGKICSCAYAIDIEGGDIVELILLNMGTGKGWSHPVHLHGHSFYVKLFGFPDYDPLTGRFLAENDDIECVDDFCNEAKWRGRNKRQATQPRIRNRIPPLKDTIIVPSGGYVQIRFKADNPGVWFLHCHIDLHNTNGMAMMVNESFSKYSKMNIPDDFPKCGDFPGPISDSVSKDSPWKEVAIGVIVVAVLAVVVVVILSIWIHYLRR